jgi:hypothetical protein
MTGTRGPSVLRLAAGGGPVSWGGYGASADLAAFLGERRASKPGTRMVSAVVWATVSP